MNNDKTDIKSETMSLDSTDRDKRRHIRITKLSKKSCNGQKNLGSTLYTLIDVNQQLHYLQQHIHQSMNEWINESMNQSINQSKQIFIAPYVASESEAHNGRDYVECLNSTDTHHQQLYYQPLINFFKKKI